MSNVKGSFQSYLIYHSIIHILRIYIFEVDLKDKLRSNDHRGQDQEFQFYPFRETVPAQLYFAIMINSLLD